VILFIVKKFQAYGSSQASTGLWTSAGFVVDMLNMEGHHAKLVEAIDGNCIDRLVTENPADLVILEAIWITPEKMQELRRLHPRQRFVVRVHSEIPFLANEGNSIAWLKAYAALGVTIAFNSAQARSDFDVIGASEFLPNYYPLQKIRIVAGRHSGLDIGCFGAIRPMKNQLIQALAAIRFADAEGSKLRFHMNASRVEQGGDSVLKAICAVFEGTAHELVLHPWLEHGEFIDLIRTMDYCLQVSLSESFNIVSADAVSLGVPLIGSTAISWLPRRSRAAVDSSAAIAEKLRLADATTVHMNHDALESYVAESIETWNDFID
jgi:hypothetical protein